MAINAAQTLRDSLRAAEAGAQLLEYRVDRLSDAAAVADLVRKSPLPCIVTCRPMWEGGQSDLSDSARLDLLRAGLEAGAAYIDFELQAARGLTIPADVAGRLIVSSHDFSGRPDRLYNLLAELNATAAAVSKIVWTARTVRDNLEVFDILQKRQRPTIALCMGEAGLISRVLAKKFGGFLSFAALEEQAGTAPGQISITRMKRLYRWDAIGRHTRVYGVAANPVAHSRSPLLHNTAFDQMGIDAVYLPLLVQDGYESFKAFMETFRHTEGLDFSGLSITLPHKENALRYTQEVQGEIEPLAEKIGAVNTYRMDGEKLEAFNSDYAAILESMAGALGCAVNELAGKRVAVIGAGGTGRTATAALASYGCRVTLFNRTLERAEELAREFYDAGGTVRGLPLEQLAGFEADIFFNATSVGLHPATDRSPLDGAMPKLQGAQLAFDSIYNPPHTRFLQQAEEAGVATIGGIEMFLRQGARQFELWTRQAAPLAAMRQALQSQ